MEAMPLSKTRSDAVPLARRKRRTSSEVSDRILEAAGEEFEQSGYGGATTAAIARRAEVTEAQIFRLFGSKRELFHAAIFEPLNRHFADFQARYPTASAPAGDTETVARRYVGELQDFTARHSRMLLSLIAASAYSPDTVEPVGDMRGLLAYFERGAATMTKRVGAEANVEPELMVRVSFAAVIANVMFKDWLFPPGLASELEIREAIGAFVLHGIGANQNQL